MDKKVTTKKEFLGKTKPEFDVVLRNTFLKSGISEAFAARIVSNFIEEVKDAATKYGKVEIPNLGVIECVYVKEKSNNIRDGVVPAHHTFKFRVSSKAKEYATVNAKTPTKIKKK